MLTIPGVAAALSNPLFVGSAGAHYVLLIAGMFVRSKGASIAVLVLLSLRYLFQYLI